MLLGISLRGGIELCSGCRWGRMGGRDLGFFVEGLIEDYVSVCQRGVGGCGVFC